MLFSEIYSSYFNAVAAILKEAVRGDLTDARLNQLVMDKAFSESILTIPEGVKGSWALIREGLTTPVKHEPEMPLSMLQKRWLKSLLEDPRIKLFDSIDQNGTSKLAEGLEDVKPLFTTDMIEVFDKYGDGDPYESTKYIENFRIILQAFHEKRKLYIHFKGRQNKFHRWECIPYWLEYSAKDDKFRLITESKSGEQALSINLARVKKCSLREPYTDSEYNPPAIRKEKLVMEVIDKRNALERVMLHFSHLAKEAERIDDQTYRLTIEYDKEDDTELIIRVLSFGPLVKVLGPDKFITKLKKRIEKQMEIQKVVNS